MAVSLIDLLYNLNTYDGLEAKVTTLTQALRRKHDYRVETRGEHKDQPSRKATGTDAGDKQDEVMEILRLLEGTAATVTTSTYSCCMRSCWSHKHFPYRNQVIATLIRIALEQRKYVLLLDDCQVVFLMMVINFYFIVYNMDILLPRMEMVMIQVIMSVFMLFCEGPSWDLLRDIFYEKLPLFTVHHKPLTRYN